METRLQQVVKVRARVVIGVRVVDGHISKVREDMQIEEILDDAVIEIRVNEHGSDESLDDVGEAFWWVGDGSPVVFAVAREAFGFEEFGGVIADLMFELRVVVTEMVVESDVAAQSSKEFVRDHGHFVFGEPLRVFGGIFVEEVGDGSHVEESVAKEFEALVVGDFFVDEWH